MVFSITLGLKNYLDNNGKIMLNTYVENIKKSKNYWLLSLKKQNKKKNSQV